MTVYIHVGTPKTGSTSIQTAMDRNARRLRRDYSINYPAGIVNHWGIVLPFVDENSYEPLNNRLLRRLGTKERYLAAAARLHRHLRRDARRYRTHVLSSEQILFDNRPAIARLKGFFDEIGLESKIIVYVRHPAELVSSLLSQHIRGGRATVASFEGVDQWTPAIRVYAETFGKENMIVRRFDRRDFVNGSLIDDFTAIVNGEPIPGLDPGRLNESLSIPAIMLAEKLYDTSPYASTSRGPTPYLDRIPGPKFVAPRPIVERALQTYRGYSEYLGREFGIAFDDVDLSRFPESLSWEFTEEALAEVANIINEQALTIRVLKAELRDHKLDRRVKSAIAALKGLFRPAGNDAAT